MDWESAHFFISHAAIASNISIIFFLFVEIEVIDSNTTFFSLNEKYVVDKKATI